MTTFRNLPTQLADGLLPVATAGDLPGAASDGETRWVSDEATIYAYSEGGGWAAVGGSSGSVGSGGSSTDNAIPRWDGTDGLTLQDSGISIDDLNNLSGIADISFTGTLNANSNLLTNVATPVSASDAATKAYADSLSLGLSWRTSVISTITAPSSPTSGDRHIVASGGTGDFAGQDDNIAEYDGAAWSFETPLEGWTVYVEDVNKYCNYNGAAWVNMGSLFHVVDDTTPQLGGTLDIQAHTITTSVTNGPIILDTSDGGKLQARSDRNPRGTAAVDWQIRAFSNTAVASGNYSAICGGLNNTASANYATAAGGRSSVASGSYSFVGGGEGCTATDQHTTVAGGSGCHATGSAAAVAGGTSVTASGNSAFGANRSNTAQHASSAALGQGARTTADRDFVLGNSTGATSTVGNVHFRVAGDTSGVHVGRSSDQAAVVGAENKLELHTILANNQSRATRIRANDALSASYDLQLPAAQGGSGQVLENDGAGNLSWATPGGGGGSNSLLNTRFLASSTSSGFSSSSLDFTGLTIGEWYRVEIHPSFRQPAVGNYNCEFRASNGGTIICRRRLLGDTATQSMIDMSGATRTFQATATTVTFTFSSGAPMVLEGDGTALHTYVQLIELADYAAGVL